MGLFTALSGKRPQSLSLFAKAEPTEVGLAIPVRNRLEIPTSDALLAAAELGTAADIVLAAYLRQLMDEGSCVLAPEHALLPWSHVYALIESADHSQSLLALGLPPVRSLSPILDCEGTLADPTFELSVDGWYDGKREVRVPRRVGAIVELDGSEWLLPFPSWQTADAIQRLATRGNEERSQHENELAWGGIRQLAEGAEALYRSPYLETTVVLTPETLRLPMQREVTPFGRVTTVAPTFSNAPTGWLNAFDGFNSVQRHYDLTPKNGGHVRVVISEPVRKVLEVIKREMPGRRVAGSKAERFVHNPWAFLGEAAHGVIREEEFAADRAAAGPVTSSFFINPSISSGRVETVHLVITEQFHGGGSRTHRVNFESPARMATFADALERAAKDDRMVLAWEDFDLSLDGESLTQLDRAHQIAHLWMTQPAAGISYEDIYELEGYSDRIEGIGVARAVYVPVFQKSVPEEGKPGWMPSDLTPMVKVTLAGNDGQVLIPLTKEWVEKFDEQVRSAESRGEDIVRNDSLPTSLRTGEARKLADAFRVMLGVPGRVKADGDVGSKEPKAKGESLIVKLNFFGVDYAEARRQNLTLPPQAVAQLPRSLRPSVTLKQHQLDGIAWFQHLVSRAPMDCRGALLADDMGLGKTLQLLCVLGRYYEQHPEAAPSLILCPKSLVENWAAEAKKFFTDSFPEQLVLYGDELKARKQPLSLIDSQLRARGVIDLLRPNWIGTAKVVFTSYEVLTNFEFSLARQPFAFVICDEAQRIKTPGTQVTIATKALKADFRVACTGTPVENTLADLWCLFDFVQPGLLGGLEEFGRTFRKPIECETEDQRAALSKLQDMIRPQTLRRTKDDIAGELPKKRFAYTPFAGAPVAFKGELTDSERLHVAMSSHQNLLYLGGLKKLQDAAKESDGRKRARLSFGALHLMKAVCAEPYCLPGMKFLPDKDGHAAHLANSPKLAWLLDALQPVREAGEKAIVFTELREVQSSLYYFLRERFGIRPFIINGDSQNRHSYITRFSETPGFDVIILSTLAAGAGLNVTAANHVFHFTRAWNPSKENQATDRAFRIGQERDVFVYCPITSTEQFVTFDIRLDELLRKKATLASAAVGTSDMTAMLNGTSIDVSFTQLVGSGMPGMGGPKRFLGLDDIDRMEGLEFEILCQVLWSRRGYTAHLTEKRGGDGGIDVLAFRGAEGELLQCKRTSNDAIGWDAVKEVAAGAARYRAQFPGTAFECVAVTNTSFNTGARAQAEANRVRLVERRELEEMLAQYAITNEDMDVQFSDSVSKLIAA
jgi:HJR/Mrr/RecB family endonuclease